MSRPSPPSLASTFMLRPLWLIPIINENLGTDLQIIWTEKLISGCNGLWADKSGAQSLGITLKWDYWSDSCPKLLIQSTASRCRDGARRTDKIPFCQLHLRQVAGQTCLRNLLYLEIDATAILGIVSTEKKSIRQG